MEDARRYESSKYIVNAVGFALNTIVLIYLHVSGSTFAIRNFAVRVAPGPYPSVVVLVYFAVIGVILTALQLPLDYLSGYHLEHRFGLSRQSRRDWFSDQIKGFAL